ncbi:MAG: DUF501 domain-containing protein [Coriobacteriia bacterium]|nr:DUF501 domain-containing protein [Coriobacteriia bacterium]
MMHDHAVVTRQLGRAPRGTWRPVARCSFGHPTCIVTAPMTGPGEPFPTLYYLTCPHLSEAVSALESDGAIDRWRIRIATEPELAERLRRADAEYRRARAAEGGGEDPTPDVGIAGQRDVGATKCLHAHVAAFLAGIDDPVGEGVLGSIPAECADGRCGEATG